VATIVKRIDFTLGDLFTQDDKPRVQLPEEVVLNIRRIVLRLVDPLGNRGLTVDLTACGGLRIFFGSPCTGIRAWITFDKYGFAFVTDNPRIGPHILPAHIIATLEFYLRRAYREVEEIYAPPPT